MCSETEFRLDEGSNSLILVPVDVNGVGPYQFILDTGASHSLLSQELASSLGVQPEQEKQAMGAAGTVKAAFAHAGIAVGSMRKNNVPVAVTGELRRIGLAIQNRVDGCLGYSFLKDFVLTIDYQHKVLYQGRPSHHEAGGRYIAPAWKVPFKLALASKPLMLVPVRVNGQGPYQFTVDTGAAITVISRDLASKLNIATVGGCAATGGGGQVSILGGRVDSIAVGDASVRDQAIGMGDFLRMLSTAVSVELDGIIGHNFLSSFRVTIDYPGSTLELSPATGENSGALQHEERCSVQDGQSAPPMGPVAVDGASPIHH